MTGWPSIPTPCPHSPHSQLPLPVTFLCLLWVDTGVASVKTVLGRAFLEVPGSVGGGRISQMTTHFYYLSIGGLSIVFFVGLPSWLQCHSSGEWQGARPTWFLILCPLVILISSLHFFRIPQCGWQAVLSASPGDSVACGICRAEGWSFHRRQ